MSYCRTNCWNFFHLFFFNPQLYLVSSPFRIGYLCWSGVTSQKVRYIHKTCKKCNRLLENGKTRFFLRMCTSGLENTIVLADFVHYAPCSSILPTSVWAYTKSTHQSSSITALTSPHSVVKRIAKQFVKENSCRFYSEHITLYIVFWK